MRQRLRWVRGHLGVLRWHWPRLAGRALRGDLRALDMALYILLPTRMLTRVGTSGALLLALLRMPFALPLAFTGVAVATEWGVPAFIGWRERLVALNATSLRLAARHSVLSLLWFPIVSGRWSRPASGPGMRPRAPGKRAPMSRRAPGQRGPAHFTRRHIRCGHPVLCATWFFGIATRVSITNDIDIVARAASSAFSPRVSATSSIPSAHRARHGGLPGQLWALRRGFRTALPPPSPAPCLRASPCCPPCR